MNLFRQTPMQSKLAGATFLLLAACAAGCQFTPAAAPYPNPYGQNYSGGVPQGPPSVQPPPVVQPSPAVIPTSSVQVSEEQVKPQVENPDQIAPPHFFGGPNFGGPNIGLNLGFNLDFFMTRGGHGGASFLGALPRRSILYWRGFQPLGRWRGKFLGSQYDPNNQYAGGGPMRGLLPPYPRFHPAPTQPVFEAPSDAEPPVPLEQIYTAPGIPINIPNQGMAIPMPPNPNAGRSTQQVEELPAPRQSIPDTTDASEAMEKTELAPPQPPQESTAGNDEKNNPQNPGLQVPEAMPPPPSNTFQNKKELNSSMGDSKSFSPLLMPTPVSKSPSLFSQDNETEMASPQAERSPVLFENEPTLPTIQNNSFKAQPPKSKPAIPPLPDDLNMSSPRPNQNQGSSRRSN